MRRQMKSAWIEPFQNSRKSSTRHDDRLSFFSFRQHRLSQERTWKGENNFKVTNAPGIQQMADFIDEITQNHRLGGAKMIVDV